jgi:hypothetical protein
MPAQPPAPPQPPQPGAPGTITVPVEPGAPGAFDPRTGEPVQPTPATDPNGVWGTGVVPATPPAPAQPVVPQPAPVPAPVAQPIQPVTIDGHTYFTADAIEQARREEREKLYGRLEEQGQQLRSVTEFVQQEQQRREQAEKDAADAAERERQAGLTVDQRMAEMENRFLQREQTMQQELAQRDAILERERQFNALQEFRTRRVAEESDLIHPSLVGLVQGNSEAEIEQSITAVKASTDAMVQDIQGQQVAQRQQMRTVAPTGAPPVGPSDNASGQQTYTAEDISAMDNATYAKHRGALLQAASARAAAGTLYQP